ncbi:MAG: hypothetical protein ACFFAV_08045 [Candidatus Hermodarchaeota archaeon]
MFKYLRKLTGRSHVRYRCSISEHDDNHAGGAYYYSYIYFI